MCMRIHILQTVALPTLLSFYTSPADADPLSSDWCFSVQGSENGKSNSESDLDHSP